MTETILDKTATVRSFLFADVPGDPVDALTDALRGRGALAPLVPRIPGIAAVVDREVAAATDGLLSLDLADVAATGWKKFDALRQAARRTLDDQDAEEVVTLVSHEIECRQQPTVDLYIDGKSIATIQIDLQMAMNIAGGRAVVRQGRLMEFKTASCAVSAALSVQQIVVKTCQRQLDLPGGIRLRRGVALLADEDRQPIAEAIAAHLTRPA